jgi:hypothetical protein
MTTTKNPDVEGSLKTDVTVPGQQIYTDQVVSLVRGRKFHTAGSESDHDKYSGAPLFVDITSGYIYVVSQVTLNAMDTINGKHELERHALEMGVNVKSYHTDNGVYKSQAFTEELTSNNQSIHFSTSMWSWCQMAEWCG